MAGTSVFLLITRFLARRIAGERRRQHEKRYCFLGGGGCQKKRGAAKARERALTWWWRITCPTRRPPARRRACAGQQLLIAAACLAAARQHRVDGVFTLGTDQPVLTAAAVSQALGLACPITPRTALAVTNKRVMKGVFRAAGIPTVRWKLVSAATGPEELRGLRPLVIKPLDSQGQRGIFKVQSAGGALEKLPETLRWSRGEGGAGGGILPQRRGDRFRLGGTGARHPADGDRPAAVTMTRCTSGGCTGHRFPSVHMDRAAELDGLCQRICTAFGIEAGPLYVQVLVGAGGILVNEVACRVGGAFEDVTIPYLTGFDILGAVIDQCLGRPVDTAPLRGSTAPAFKKRRQFRCCSAAPAFWPGKPRWKS